MRFFKRKKSESPASRRNARIWLLQARRAALCGVCAALVLAGGVAAYRFLPLCKAWLGAQALEKTAAAGFRVKNILVTGREHVRAEDVLASLAVTQGQPIFGVDIDAARQELAALPWVKDTIISRRLPDTLSVALQERVPAALWQRGGKLALIDADGIVLADENLAAWENLPLVVGAGADKAAAALLAALAAEPAVAQSLAAAVRIEGRRWNLALKNGMTVKLPEQDMELALSTLAALDAEKSILSRTITAIDLRQPGRLVVTPEAPAPEQKQKT